MSGKAKKISLTDNQKDEIIKMHKRDMDLMDITRRLFGNNSLDGRSKEGRAVRSYLDSQNKEYKTSLAEKVGSVTFTDQQKEFILSDNVEAGMNALEIARLTFQDPEIKSLSIKHRATIDFLKNFRSDVVDDNELVTTEKWTPPKAISRAILKCNNWCDQNLEETNLQRRDELKMSRLLFYLKSPRFIHIINQYSTLSDRDLFESEFVRAVWDKPDLTNDELNLYITVCANYVRQKHIQSRIDKLNNLMNDSDSERDITIRLTELLKTTSEELNQCEKRIESLTKDLNGSRTQRLKARGAENGSIFALVEEFTEKEGRDRMIMKAEYQNKLNIDGADVLETMDEFKARVLGISKKEIT